MMTNLTENTQDPDNTAAGAVVTTKEIRQTTAAEEKNMEEYIQTMSKLIKAMMKTTLTQKNVKLTTKEGLPKLQEALNSLIVLASLINGPPTFDRKEKYQAQG